MNLLGSGELDIDAMTETKGKDGKTYKSTPLIYAIVHKQDAAAQLRILRRQNRSLYVHVVLYAYHWYPDTRILIRYGVSEPI